MVKILILYHKLRELYANSVGMNFELFSWIWFPFPLPLLPPIAPLLSILFLPPSPAHLQSL